MTDRPRRRRTARITLFGAVIAAILGTGACSTLNDVQSPRSAREAAAAKSGHQPGGGAQFVNCAVQKCIALTFDGGPSAPTPKHLDVLKKEHVHVTLFVQGKGHIDTCPQTLRRIAAEGHEIGNHTSSHKVHRI
jgi:peptidoglycan/xylan/chitin deacetylase (PgdA/CDA1 family)